MQFINKHIKNLNAICKKHQVKRLFVFGSALTENFNEESDIDFLVSFNQMDLYGYFDNYMSLKTALEKLFGRSVDLVEEQVLKNPILIQSINKNKKLIYERESLEMVV
jgi:uncharacterized protein